MAVASSMSKNFTSLVDVLSDHRQTKADALAYQFLGNGEEVSDSITYGELDRQARAGAVYLSNRLQAGDRVLLLFPAGIDFVIAFLSCLYAGMVAVPMALPNHQRTLLRCLNVLKNADSQWILTNQKSNDRFQELLEGIDGIAQFNWLVLEDISLTDANIWRPSKLQSELAFLQYTSGSTGNPKGVMVSHQNLLYNVDLIANATSLADNAHIVCWLPTFHDWGLIGFLLHGLYAGVVCTFMEPMSFMMKPVRWLQAISRYRATFSGAPNFAYELCLKMISSEQRKSLDLSAWQAALIGAEPIRFHTLETFYDVFQDYGLRREAFLPCYGLAESTLWVSGCAVKKAPNILHISSTALREKQVEILPHASGDNCISLVSSGASVGNHQIIIVNPKTKMPCQLVEIGEVWVAGSSIASGYWNDLDRTKETFQAHLINGQQSFLRTGDLGFLYQGELYITGRLKDLIIIAGRNYYPQDIEMTVENCHPDLRVGNGAAFVIEAQNQEQLVIIQELIPGKRPAMDYVIATINRAIASTHGIMASAILLVKAGTIPKTSSGKVMRYACKQNYENNALPTVAVWHSSELKNGH